MAKTIQSNNVTFIDLTDSRKVDVHITSNLPTTQIFDGNTNAQNTYSPNWASTPLRLTLTAYADSTDITSLLTNDGDITWYRQIGSGDRTKLQNVDTQVTISQNGTQVTISQNELCMPEYGLAAGVISYICLIKYNNKNFESKMTFARVDAGIKGDNGTPAPAVQAKYSADGNNGWVSTLNTAVHKYIQYSYDGGHTWTNAIKMVGEDGTSVNIKGTATSKSPVTDTAYYTLVYGSETITGAAIGDAYLLDGNLYVCVDSKDGEDHFMDVGQIQGPPGNDGKSSYVFIRYATDANGRNMALTPSSETTHIGICVSQTNIAPTSTSLYTWSKFVGDNAKSIVLSGDSQVFKVSSSNVYEPSSIQVTAQAFNTSITTWTYSTDGGRTFVADAPNGVTRVNDVVTIAGATLSFNSIVIKASDGTVEDVFTVYKAFDGVKGADGESAQIAFLTNENVTFAADENGNIATISIPTSIVAYNGSQKVTPEVSKNKDDSYAISGLPTGMSCLVGDAVDHTIPLTFTMTNNSSVGYASQNNGNIEINIDMPNGDKLILYLTWSIVKSGTKGAKGDAGSDSYTVLLTNESHIFAGDVSNALAGSTDTQILAYKGSSAQTVRIVSVDGLSPGIIDTNTNKTGLKFVCDKLSSDQNGPPKITFKCTTALKENGTIPIIVDVGGVQFTKIFTYSISFKGNTGGTGAQGLQGPQGQPGASASLVNVTPSAWYFKSTTGKDGTFTPEYIYLYPRFQTVTYSKWEYSTNGGSTWITASGANGLTISTYDSTANTLRIARTSTLYTDMVTSISFRCVSSNASVYDTVSIAKIYDVVDLQIGGRNLLPSSFITYDGTTKEVILSTWGTNFVNTDNLLSILEPNTTYTFSYNAEIIEKTSVPTLYHDNIGFSFYSSTVSTANREMTIRKVTELNSFVKYTSSFITPAELPSDYRMIAYTNRYTTNGGNPIGYDNVKFTNIKLEKGNKATDWSPAHEDLANITFQIFAPNGYLLTKELQSLTLQTFAYEGSIEIKSGATFQWSHLIDDVWTEIDGATGTTLTVTKSDVLKSKSYRCVMTYNGQSYTSTVTVQDKTDTYNSIMCISSNATSNDCYWVLYTLVYNDAEEVDPLLGPVSVTAPASPVSGNYWYAVDSANAKVTLKKYNGTSWVDSTDTQSLSYYWDMINDGSTQVPLGASSKVKVVTCNDFTATATLVCEVSNVEDGLLTQSSLSITDASDPIVSTTEPKATVNGQIWIKPNDNGTYLMFVWDASLNNWISSDMDTRSKVYTSKPSSYNAGDLWITASDTDHGTYLHGTLLQAQKSNTSYSAADWSPTLRYDQDIDAMKETLNNLSQYVTITSAGLRIGARNSSGQLSPFTSLFTSTELSFYQNAEKLLTLANNQLTAPRIVVEDDLAVQGSISLGNLKIIIENNGSFSFAVQK